MTRALFAEWLVSQDPDKKFEIGSSRHTAKSLLTNPDEVVYNVMYERWRARDAGNTNLIDGSVVR